ncbi:hypothetical protein [Herbiconiux sp. A18JL235]|uniref:Htaa domain-containing protein n=1 Tax=Herbiconiux sp. A18JL235 TaxID=3152363 RepID=A0AB39BG14_9MICO
MDSSTPRRRFRRTALAGLTVAALTLGGVLAAAPAHAAETTVDGAVFRWGLNAESNAAAFAPGTVNLLSAGVVTATSSADRVTQSTWKQSEGNTKILKRQADGSYADATFAGLRTDASGTTITTGNGLNSGHVAEISAGTGTVDVDANTAVIQWTGTFTSAYYSGMTRSWITDPTLTVDSDGTGTITATLGGYGTSMDDPDKFETLEPVEDVVVATLTGVDVTPTGFTVTPDYLGRTVTTPADGVAQVTSGAYAGAFPQPFVDFQSRTGQGSYWYSSGGAADTRKPAGAVSVAYTAAPVASVPTVTVSKTSGLTQGETVTVSGSGFLPSGTATNGTRPPLAGQFSGTYVVFGKFAEAWKPSTGAASSTRSVIAQKWALPAASMSTVGGANAGAIELKADGTFSVDLTLTTTEAQNLAAGNFGIYTYPGSGASYAPFETYTPLAFSAASDVIVEVPDWVDNPTGSFGWAFEGTSPANLGTAVQDGGNFVAAGSLTNIVVTDTRAGGTAPFTWSISGQAGDFASTGGGSFSAGYLGWKPKVVAGAVTGGAEVASTRLGGTGLGSSRVLASSTSAVSATVGAELSLVIPGTTTAGDYTSTLTITALQ